jgi:hypothetical protein
MKKVKMCRPDPEACNPEACNVAAERIARDFAGGEVHLLDACASCVVDKRGAVAALDGDGAEPLIGVPNVYEDRGGFPMEEKVAVSIYWDWCSEKVQRGVKAVTKAAETVLKMLESLPGEVQDRVVERLREWIEDLRDETKWDELFERRKAGLVEAARKARQDARTGKAEDMDYTKL